MTFQPSPPSLHDALPISGAALCGLTSTTLGANTPVVGTGAWSIVSGVGGSFGNGSSSISSFSGVAGNSYTLRWTSSNEHTAQPTSDLLITCQLRPTVANA